MRGLVVTVLVGSATVLAAFIPVVDETWQRATLAVLAIVALIAGAVSVLTSLHHRKTSGVASAFARGDDSGSIYEDNVTNAASFHIGNKKNVVFRRNRQTGG